MRSPPLLLIGSPQRSCASEADCSFRFNVVSKGGIAAFDHRVGLCCSWNVGAERLGGLRVDDERELGRLLA